MGAIEKAYPYYPEPAEVDQWMDEIWKKAEEIPCVVTPLPDGGWRNDFGTFHANTILIKFQPEDLPAFYGVWQSALNGPAPLVVHLPGYGAELSCHPDMAACGFNLLNLSPYGYWTPNGFDESRRDPQTGSFPVLPETLRTNREHGYKDWLRCVVYAIKWAWRLETVIPDRVSFYGTSQGGGTAVLAGSLFRDHGIRCIAADEPYLTDYPLANLRGAYNILTYAVQERASEEEAYRILGIADTLSHTHRITCPILVTTGTADTVCPPETVTRLYERLDGTHAMITYKDRGHGYAREFMRMAEAWLKMYA